MDNKTCFFCDDGTPSPDYGCSTFIHPGALAGVPLLLQGGYNILTPTNTLSILYLFVQKWHKNVKLSIGVENK